jgi:hypothetical protein
VFPGKLNGLFGPAREHRRDGKDHCSVGIPFIPLRALDVGRTGRLPQLISVTNSPVLSPATARAPAAVRDAMLDGEVQGGPACAGLSTSEFLDRCLLTGLQ